jgi:nucleolin
MSTQELRSIKNMSKKQNKEEDGEELVHRQSIKKSSNSTKKLDSNIDDNDATAKEEIQEDNAFTKKNKRLVDDGEEMVNPKKSTKQPSKSEKKTKISHTDDDIEVLKEESHEDKGPTKRSKTPTDNFVESAPEKSIKRAKQDPSMGLVEQPGEVENLTVYLAGFPFDSNIEEIVREKTNGVREVRIHTWHDTGRSRGCAHVDYESRGDLEDALKHLDRMVVGSRYITAVEANSKAANVAPPEKEDDSRGGRKLFVKNIPYDMTENEMKDVFANFGAVKSVRIPQWHHTSNQKGFGYIEFEQKSFAVACVKSHRENPIKVKGRQVKIDYDQGRPKRGFKDERGRAWYKPAKDSNTTGAVKSKKM